MLPGPRHESALRFHGLESVFPKEGAMHLALIEAFYYGSIFIFIMSWSPGNLYGEGCGEMTASRVFGDTVLPMRSISQGGCHEISSDSDRCNVVRVRSLRGCAQCHIGHQQSRV